MFTPHWNLLRAAAVGLLLAMIAACNSAGDREDAAPDAGDATDELDSNDRADGGDTDGALPEPDTGSEPMDAEPVDAEPIDVTTDPDGDPLDLWGEVDTEVGPTDTNTDPPPNADTEEDVPVESLCGRPVPTGRDINRALPLVAFVENPGGDSDIRLLSLADGDTTPVLQDPDAMFLDPVFSPDGGYLAAVRVDARGSGVILLDLRCGEILELVPPGIYRGVGRLAWRSTDTIGFLAGEPVPGATRSLYLADLDTGTVTLHFAPAEGEWVQDLAWVVDRWFLSIGPGPRPIDFGAVGRVVSISEDGAETVLDRDTLAHSFSAAPDLSDGVYFDFSTGLQPWLDGSTRAPHDTGFLQIQECAPGSADLTELQFVCVNEDLTELGRVSGSLFSPVYTAPPFRALASPAISPVASDAFVLLPNGVTP